MATVQCRSSKCTAERKGFRRELDSWRHKLIHCIGFESILEGIYGSMLLRDLNLFEDCEPEEVDDWSPEVSCSHCSFCSLPLDKLNDHVPAAASSLSSPSDYSPTQALTLSESSQSAHRFLQAVFHKKDVPLGCDSNIPLIAQELMKKMIHQFALEYASKSLLHTNTNGITTRSSSPLSDLSDAPLDLTVSRSQEKEMEPQPDGVLDLSKRNSACPAASTSASSPNHKISGFPLPSLEEDFGDKGQQETQCRHNSVLDAILSSLCPVHRSLLYQILKLANQEQLLSFLYCRPVDQKDSHCCHCGITPHDNVTPRPLPFSECKAHNSSSHYLFIDCDRQDHSSTVYHRDSQPEKSSCSNCHYPFSDCKSKGSQSCCCVQSCRVPAYPVFCLKSLHCMSCQSLTVGHIDNMVCSFASSPSLSKSASLCTTSICCNQHNSHSCPCCSNHVCLTQVRNSLKREQSPSPPPLSPIPADINSKTEEKPPSLLHHIQEVGADLSPPLMVKDSFVDVSHQDVDLDKATEEELECKSPKSSQTEQNLGGNLLQHVVDRFSEKLETITPLDKDSPLSPSAILATEEEQSQSPASSQSLQFHADAHLTEIITTVLHTGSDSDYNLNDLFHHHDSKQPKSPNTRSRRRQEVLAALSTPNDDASTRRHSLQIKRELAMLDQSYCRRKVPPAKRAKLKNGNIASPTSNTSLDTNLVKKESNRETEITQTIALFAKQDVLARDELENKNMMVGNGSIIDNGETGRIMEKGEGKISQEHSVEEGVEKEKVMGGSLNMLTALNGTHEVKEEIEAITVTEEVQIIKTEEREREMVTEEARLTLLGNQLPTLEVQCKLGSKGECKQTQMMVTTTQCKRPCEIDGKANHVGCDRNDENVPPGQRSDGEDGPGKSKDDHRPIEGRQKISVKSQSNCFTEERKSRRNIVPPQRFSSYVTEPRKMYFVACFSEGIFNQKSPKENVDTASKNPDLKDTLLESRNEAQTSHEHAESTQQYGTSDTESKDQSQVFPLARENRPTEHSSQNKIDGRECATKPCRRLRSSPQKIQDSKTVSRTLQNLSKEGATISYWSATGVLNAPNSHIEYTSPIKLMYVSPVGDTEGVKYSLKSAGSGSSAQTEESFDPCQESSWAGTPERNKNQITEAPQLKSMLPPLKSATSPARSASASPKSASSPPKSSLSIPKSTTSPPKSSLSPSKISSRRLGESTPPKRASGTESQRSPTDLNSHETTPPKRRPGRPKKLGPQLENKVKRPIGRPRKQKPLDPVTGTHAVNSVLASDKEENVNKNLKITVVYGRSRRNKRMVSEGFEQLHTEFHDAWQAVNQNNNLSSLTQNSQTCSGSIKAASTEWSKNLNLVRPMKERVPHSSSNVKCQKHDAALPVRKPGRPAKVKISGISVTVTTVSPRQRKIQLNKDRQSPETLNLKKALLPVFKSAKEPRTISHQISSNCSQMEGKLEEKDANKDNLPNQPVAVRQSMRVRKPSMYFLHSVATSASRSYSRSTALLKRSKQLMLNKAMNERKEEVAQSVVETVGEKNNLSGQVREHISQDLSQVAGVSVDSIFSPKDTLRWWAASTEEKALNQELARRIRLISDTWVSDTVENQDEEAFNTKLGTKGNSSPTKKSRHSSLVRILFDCPANKPRSCNMQQLCTWFMQTTETQSLAIVKKASSRNPYEFMHFSRSANKTSVRHSPQAERLRKHIKKFARIVPKSPFQHQQAKKRLRKMNKTTGNVKRQLFTPRFAPGCLSQGASWVRGRAVGKYLTTLLRARTRFLTQKERKSWPKRQNNEKVKKNGQEATVLQPKHKALNGSATDQLVDCLENSSTTNSVDQTQKLVHESKEHKLSSKAWSPETLKECRVFLRKINSPENESAEEEWDSCTVTLDDGSPSAYQFPRSDNEMVGFVKAVKTERKRCSSRRTASSPLGNSAPKSNQKQIVKPLGRQKNKYKHPEVVSTELSQPTPAKTLRQSRMRGLTGPRWCDFVFEN